MFDADMSILESRRISSAISRANIFNGQSDGMEKIANEKIAPYQADKMPINN